MEQMNVISLLRLMPDTKEEKAAFINRFVSEIEQGIVDPIPAYRLISTMKSLFEDMVKNESIREYVIDAIHGFPECVLKLQYRKSYDYSTCGDSTYDSLYKEKKAIDAKLKQRELFLKSIPTNGTIDPDTGEFIHPASYNETEIITKAK